MAEPDLGGAARHAQSSRTSSRDLGLIGRFPNGNQDMDLHSLQNGIKYWNNHQAHSQSKSQSQNIQARNWSQSRTIQRVKSLPSITSIIRLVVMAFSTACLLSTLIIILAQFLVVEATPLSSFSDNDHGISFSSTKPIACHSHNDYWRKQPLFSALRTGCIALEADVYAVNNELFVSHEEENIKGENTLSNMYLDPLFSILHRNNPPTLLGDSFIGIYDVQPKQTLVLLVDFKTRNLEIWHLLLSNLQSLRERGWLSHVQNGTFIARPVTVVVTGETQMDHIIQNPWRDVFLDAPLADLDRGVHNMSNSYYASVSFKKSIGTFHSSGMKPEQIAKVRKQIKQAHDLGLKVRYWALPAHPKQLRDKLWEVLIEEGVDVLNVDDLGAAKAIYLRRLMANT